MLTINDPDESDEKYVQGYAIWTNALKVDLPRTVAQCGTELTVAEVMDFFDDEFVLEYENQSDNPLNKGGSLVRNLNEWTGSLKKVCDQEGAKFYKVGDGDEFNVFVVLSQPLTKKRKR